MFILTRMDSMYYPDNTGGKDQQKFIHTNLENGQTYKYYVRLIVPTMVLFMKARNLLKNQGWQQRLVTQVQRQNYLKQKSTFLKSEACKKNKDFTKKLDYAKSFPMPGMLNTNVAEFGCGTMIPQELP